MGWLKFHRLAGVLALLALLAGCSFKFMYPRADFFIGWQVDSYLELSSAQEDWLDERLENLLRWHHREQLPRWRDALLQFRSELVSGQMDAARYEVHAESFNALFDDTATALIPDAVRLLQQLNEDQIRHLSERLQREAEEEQEESLAQSEAEYREERYDDTLEEMSDRFGKLSDAQKQLIRRYSEETTDLRVPAVEARRHWNEFFLQLLAMRADSERLQTGLTELVLHPESRRSAEYQQAIETRRAQHRQLLAAIYQSASDKQKAHALKALDGWIEDFNELLEREI